MCDLVEEHMFEHTIKPNPLLIHIYCISPSGTQTVDVKKPHDLTPDVSSAGIRWPVVKAMLWF